MSPLFPIPVTTTRPRQPNISSSARLKSDAIGPASRSASARKASASMRTTFSPTCFMEREMLAEAAEHRVIGSSIFSGSHYLAGIFLCGHMLTASIELRHWLPSAPVNLAAQPPSVLGGLGPGDRTVSVLPWLPLASTQASHP